MQSTQDQHCHDDSDNDSLFGSPPPSPSATGRSPSPLALPSGSSSAQNVGTLALPGSHLFSELPSAQSPAPVVPRARASNLALHSQQPPLTTIQGSHGQPVNAPPQPSKPTAKSRRKQHNPNPPSRPTSKPSSTSRTTHPSIQLPPGAPPSNFLRNQQALLGLAGLVSGVNPANLALPKHARGSTSTNPIVIDDPSDTPAIGRRVLPQPKPSDLLPPTNEEIVRTLIKQKNIFPVVDALLRLISRATGPPPPPPPPEPTAFTRRGTTLPTPQPEGPPAPKKRKLANVPAGAADWDVPYPFPAGHGPADYRTNWERDRGKQLIDDLVGLVKSAARKAATKNYHKNTYFQHAQQQHQGGNGLRHYREKVLRDAGVPRKPTSVPSAPIAANATLTPPSGTPEPSNISSPALPDFSSFVWPESFDNSFGLALTSSSGTSAAGYPLGPSGTCTPAFSSTNQAEGPSLDLDEFLSLLDGLPRTDLADLFDVPVGMVDEGNRDHDITGLWGSLGGGDVGQEQQQEQQQSQSGGLDPGIFEMDPSLSAIDPTLLAISFPPDMGSRDGSGVPSTPTLIGSPLSLVGDQEYEREREKGPLTPVSSGWECGTGGEPGITFPFSGSGENEGGVFDKEKELGVSGDVVADGGSGKVSDPSFIGDTSTAAAAVGENEMSRDKGKKRARDDEVLEMPGATATSLDLHLDMAGVQNLSLRLREVLMGPQETWGPQALSTSLASMISPLFIDPANPSSIIRPPSPSPPPRRSHYRTTSQPQYTYTLQQPYAMPTFTTATATATGRDKLDKASILRRARKIREKLAEEIKRARVELWECAMEGGCLVLVGKDKGFAGGGDSGPGSGFGSGSAGHGQRGV